MDPLLRDGLEALARLLPRGYSVEQSSLTPAQGEAWIVIRRQGKQPASCLVLARRRVEPRDLGPVAAHAAKTQHAALLFSPYLSATVRERIRGFGIGCWDLAGNAQISLGAIDLCIESDTGANPSRRSERGTRSLCGEMAGRVVRALVDLRPPYALAQVAEQARVEVSCASRVIAYLGDAGIVERKPRGKIESVDWQESLRRWSLDAPPASRGEVSCFAASRGLPDLLSRLALSGFLHAITGRAAFAQMVSAEGGGQDKKDDGREDRGEDKGEDNRDGEVGPPQPEGEVLQMYVDEPTAAVSQFGLHPLGDGARVLLIKPGDRSVFHRSYERNGLRYVSPSLMVADIEESDAFEHVLAWMARHESAWRR